MAWQQITSNVTAYSLQQSSIRNYAVIHTLEILTIGQRLGERTGEHLHFSAALCASGLTSEIELLMWQKNHIKTLNTGTVCWKVRGIEKLQVQLSTVKAYCIKFGSRRAIQRNCFPYRPICGRPALYEIPPPQIYIVFFCLFVFFPKVIFK